MGVGLIFKTLGASLWMLKNHFGPIRADDFLTRFASRLEFKIDDVVRNLTIRIVCLMIAIWLTLLL